MSQACYAVFQNLSKSLCLQEFPCGIGSWRKQNEIYADSYSSITSSDYGANYERLETLQEYLKSGTWDVNTDWSSEARMLQNIAVTNPMQLTGKNGEKFILGYFRSLRLVDKEISHIDSEMTQLRKLETLVLSVNQLTETPGSHLPKKLKVLELCTNCLTSISSLCKKPPPLQHLGLSHNILQNPEEYKYFTATYWPHLLSLDLSYNNFDQLVALVDSLASLPKLRSLALQGNPLSVVPGYRGYTLDVLRDLMIFDDVHVTAEEKHRFKGLARKKECVRDEAHFFVTIDTLGGVPMPDELKDEEREEFPVVTSEYFISYAMLRGVDEDFEENEDNRDDNSAKMAIFESDPIPWVNWMEIGYKKHHVIEELRHFRDFLQRGMKVKIFCKRTKSWPVEEPIPEGRSPDSPGKKSAMKVEKENKAKKKSAKEKSKKKTGVLEIELRSDPPTYELVGWSDISLKSLMEGRNYFDEMLHCGGGPMISPEEIRKLKETEILQAEEANKMESRKKQRNASASSKGKGKKTEQTDEEAEKEEIPPKPITLQLKIELKKWHTAVESQQLD